MKKRFLALFLLLFFLSYQQFFSQNIKKDTLRARQILNNAEKISAESKFDSAAALFNQAAMIYEKYQLWDGYLTAANHRGNNLVHAGKMEQGLKVLNETLPKSLLYAGEKSLHTARSYYYLTKAYFLLGEFKKAKRYSDKNIQLSKELFGEKSLRLSMVYNLSGAIFTRLAEYDNALNSYQKALDIIKPLFGEEHAEVANPYGNMGMVYYYKGEYYKSLEYLNKALAIRKKLYGEVHAEIALNYSNLSAVAMVLARYDEAEKYLDSALEIYQNIYKSDHPDIALVYYNLGELANDRAEYKKALDFYTKSAEMLKGIYGEYHFEVARAIGGQANIYSKFSQWDKAIELAEKSLEINQTVFGEEHPKVAQSYSAIGDFYETMADYDKALKYFEKAFQIRKKVYGTFHPAIASSYKNFANYYMLTEKNYQAIENYKKALIIDKHFSGEKSLNVASIYNNLGLVYDHLAIYDTAMLYQQKSLKIKKDILGDEHIEISAGYTNIGLIYLYLGKYDEALPFLEKALRLKIKVLGEENPDVAGSYSNLALYYRVKGQLQVATEYQLMSSEILEEYPEQKLDLSLSYHNLGKLYQFTGQPQLAINYYKKSLDLRKIIYGHIHSSVASSYSAIAGYFFEIEKDDSSMVYLQKALGIRKKVLPENHPDIAENYLQMGRVAYHSYQIDTALFYILKADEVFQKQNSKNPTFKIQIINQLIKVYFEKKQPRRMLQLSQKAITLNLKNFNDTLDYYASPPLKDFYNIDLLIKSLYYKGNALRMLYEKYHNMQNIHKAIDVFESCDSLLQIVPRLRTRTKDKISAREFNPYLYEDILYACNYLYGITNDEKYLEKAFLLNEKNKAGVLLESIAEMQAKNYAGIPDNLIEKEEQIKTQISLNEQKLMQESQQPAEQVYRQNIFKLNQQLDSLVEYFEQNYPDYYKLKYSFDYISLAETQQQLDEKTAIVSYLAGDSAIFSLTVTSNDIQLNLTPKPEHFQVFIEMLRDGILEGKNSNDVSFFAPVAHKIYNIVFPENIPEHIKNLIIIPERNLNLIPFEVLLTGEYKPQMEDIPYLIKKYNISYFYSVNLFMQRQQQRAQNKKMKDLIALAPVFDKEQTAGTTLRTRNTLSEIFNGWTDKTATRGNLLEHEYISPLPATETEIKSIFKHFDEKHKSALVKTHAKATEDFVKSGELANYRIIHIATHGFVNPVEPKFSGILLAQDTSSIEDGILFSSEIYNIRLNAELTVLSACETGLGKISRGEGIIGLTRALLYAGSQNILVSLWKVADESSAQLMVDFYNHYLNENTDFSESLHKAKLNMIENKKYAHPYYWSPFILIGR